MHTTDGFRKASKSGKLGNCVEFKRVGDQVLVRDSKDPAGPVLSFTPAEIDAMRDGFARGEFDDLAV